MMLLIWAQSKLTRPDFTLLYETSMTKMQAGGFGGTLFCEKNIDKVYLDLHMLSTGL